MKEFEVTITETLQETVNIEADTKEEALRIAEENWKNGDYVLGSSHFVEVKYQSNNGREIQNTMNVLNCKAGRDCGNDNDRREPFSHAGNCRWKYSSRVLV